MKILEIALDKGVKHTSYFVLNKEVTCGTNTRFFEGTVVNNKRIAPLKEAKIWAKEKGYEKLVVLSLNSRKADKEYFL